jgi:ankyrin repeat protein
MNDEHTKDTLTLSNSANRKEIAELLSMIANGVAINPSAFNLNAAVRFGNLEIVQLLLDAGADINASDKNYDTPCRISIRFNHRSVLKLLIERGAILEPMLLVSATCSRHLTDDEIPLLLIDAGASLSMMSHFEWQMLLATTESVAVLQRMLARRIDIRQLRNTDGTTLCHALVRKPWNANIEAILRTIVAVCRVDVDVGDNAGRTPLHHAAARGNTSAMRVLVELGADVDRRDTSGMTPLACCAPAFCADLLLALGADAFVTHRGGSTAIHLAAHNRYVGMLCSSRQSRRL